jgi:hypothetical protein
MILGWKKEPLGDSYFFGKVGDVDRKFIRLLCGVILPIYDRQNGVVVVLGELYRSSAPSDLTALAACAGEWPTIENALVQYRKDLKFDHAITDCDEARDMIFRIPGLNYGIGEIPMVTYTAPKTAFTEAGRQRVNSLVSEGRLHLDEIKHVLDAEPELGLKALQAAVIWGIEYPAFYRKARRKQPEYRRLWGGEGL